MTSLVFEKKVLDYINKFGLLEPGGGVCVGFSGGADSLCLLTVLKELGYSVRAVHVNHNLRGKEAEDDENFVRMTCEQLGVQLRTFSYDVKSLSAAFRMSEEETGRRVRQSAYAECAAMEPGTKIALAHHANDLAETFIFRAARGSSLHGMAGIRPSQDMTVAAGIPEKSPFSFAEGSFDKNGDISSAETHKRNITVIHPLLGVTRDEIETYLSGRNMKWRTDRTNLDSSYTRNRIRMNVIPYLEKHVNRGIVRHMAKTAEDLALADSFLSEEAARRSEKLVESTVASVMISNEFTEEPEIIQGYILLGVLGKFSGTSRDIGREQINQIRSLFYMRSGSRAVLPYNVIAVRDYEGVTLMYEKPESSVTRRESVELVPGGKTVYGKWLFTSEFTDPAEFSPEKIKSIRYTKWFDYDKIKDNLVFRKRLPGDRIVVNEDGTSRKLREYMIDEKIPERERDDVPILASGNSVYWVVGHRTGEDCRVTHDTVHILRIHASIPGGRVHKGPKPSRAD